MRSEKPRIIYVERGTITRMSATRRRVESVGYRRDGDGYQRDGDADNAMMTGTACRGEAARAGAIAIFRRIGSPISLADLRRAHGLDPHTGDRLYSRAKQQTPSVITGENVTDAQIRELRGHPTEVHACVLRNAACSLRENPHARVIVGTMQPPVMCEAIDVGEDVCEAPCPACTDDHFRNPEAVLAGCTGKQKPEPK